MPLELHTTQLAVFISEKTPSPCQFGDSMCNRRRTLKSTPLSHWPQWVSSNRDHCTHWEFERSEGCDWEGAKSILYEMEWFFFLYLKNGVLNCLAVAHSLLRQDLPFLSNRFCWFFLLLENNTTNTNNILMVSEAHLSLFNSNDYVFT